MRLLRFFSRTTLLLLLLASLALNVATVTVGGVFTAVSAAVGAVTGASTVAARAAAKSTAQVATTQAAVRSTSRRVSARAARTAARGSASALAEAVPFLGAGAVAASVALDIADACATARDMHLLEAAVLPDADMGEFSCTREFGDAFDQWTTGALWQSVRGVPQAMCASAADYAEGAALSDLPSWVARSISGVARLCDRQERDG